MHDFDHQIFSIVLVKSIALDQYRQRQRQSGIDTEAFHFVEINHDVPSFMIYTHRNLYGALSERCKIDQDLIDYNLTRLDECLIMLAIDGREQYWTVEQQEHGYQTSFVMNEWSTALEFFLQMDGIDRSENDSLLLVLPNFSRHVFSQDVFLSRSIPANSPRSCDK